MRAFTLIGALGAAAILVPLGARDAQACGGCFHPPVPPMETGTVVTDHQMIFVTSPAQTTLYDMIKYSGAPSSFAWVLPIHGTVQVGLSSEAVFAALDQVTATTIVPPPYPSCPIPADCNCNELELGGASTGAPQAAIDAGAVNVLSMATVGPYDTVQLQSSDPTALDTWLTNNGYSIPSDVAPIIAAYVNDGFDFLALRLAPGQGVQAMRPVSVTSTGAGMTLPLRMVAAGTGATVGVTLWALSDGRLEAENFQNFIVQASQLVWDWSSDVSNYSTLVQAKETSLGNAAWQTESSTDVSPYSVENLVLGTQFSKGADASIDPTIEGYTSSDAGSGLTADQQRQQDLAQLFPGGGATVRVTRMRADLAHAALASDLVLGASADQSTVSTTYTVTNAVNVPACPNPPVCPCGSDPGIGSVGSSSSGVVGGSSGSSSGFGDAPPGTTHSSKNAFGCTASPGDSSGSGLDLVVTGMVGAAFIGSRLRRQRRSRRP